jgi:hypothetical protein
MLWELDHRDGGAPDDYLGPAHRACNSRHGAINGNTNGKRRRAAPAPAPAPAERTLCEHMRRGERHGRLCCGNSQDWGRDKDGNPC